MRTTVYVPDDQEGLIERAKAELGDSLSATFVRCIKDALELKQLAEKRIVVEIRDWKGAVSRKAFSGRMLVGREDRGEQFDWPKNHALYPSMVRYAVAESSKTKSIVLLVFTQINSEHLAAGWYCTMIETFPSFEAFSSAPQLPMALIEAVSKVLGVLYVEEMDI